MYLCYQSAEIIKLHFVMQFVVVIILKTKYRGGTCIIVDTYTCEFNNVLNPALPKAVEAGRNNDGFTEPNRRGNMKGTRVKRYKMPIYFLIYFCLCAFFSITFPLGPSNSRCFSLSQMCVRVWYLVTPIPVSHFFSLNQKYFSAYLFSFFYIIIVFFLFLNTQKKIINDSFDREKWWKSYEECVRRYTTFFLHPQWSVIVTSTCIVPLDWPPCVV